MSRIQGSSTRRSTAWMKIRATRRSSPAPKQAQARSADPPDRPGKRFCGTYEAPRAVQDKRLIKVRKSKKMPVAAKDPRSLAARPQMDRAAPPSLLGGRSQSRSPGR